LTGGGIVADDRPGFMAYPTRDPGSDAPSRGTAWAVAALVAVGAVLRAYRFWSPGLWTDEYGTWWVVAEGGWRDLVDRAVLIQGQSPFYYLIVKLSTALFGTGPFGLRLPSVVLGIATVALAYPLGLAVWRQRHAALFTVAAAAVSAPLLWYSQEARPYSLAVFCAMLSFLGYLRTLAGGGLAWRAVYVLATAGVFYAHFLFAFIVAVQVAHLALARGLGWLRSREWPLTFAALALVCLPALPQLLRLVERRAVLDWVPPVSWFAVFHLFVAYLDAPLLVVLALVTFLLGVRGVEARPLLDRASVSLVALWFVLPIAVFGAASRISSVTLLFDRYVLFILPAGLLVAAGLVGLGRHDGWRRVVPFAALLIFSLAWNLVPSLERTGGFGDRYVEDWPGAVAELETVARPEDMILYGTAFAEADQLRLAAPDPLIVSFIRAPLAANLRRREQDYTLRGLPFRINDDTMPYIRSLVSQAAGRRRVLMVGLGQSFPEIAKMLIKDGAFAPTLAKPYGLVALIVLERRN